MADAASVRDVVPLNNDPKPPRKIFNPWPAVLLIGLICLAIIFLTPVAGVVLASLKSTADIAAGDLWSLPSGVFLENFREVLANPSVPTVRQLLTPRPSNAGLGQVD